MIHGRGSRPGLVFLAPIRGVDLFVGLILHQMGEKARSVGLGEGGDCLSLKRTSPQTVIGGLKSSN